MTQDIFKHPGSRDGNPPKNHHFRVAILQLPPKIWIIGFGYPYKNAPQTTWCFQPIWKIFVKMVIFPNIQGENQKNETTQLVMVYYNPYNITG